ncbi:hypothetical protein [Nocardiopsis chromatogenes]|uniref:hypothetical protein n=1 Tax=Nocardiopsis chromatogenes TaxID=280239 RepID=UPI0003462CF6|nr:hypothetical protein [Nocardiopsis chromatogenes]
MRTLLRRTGTAAAATAAAVVLASGCSLPDAADAEPETTTFPFDGDVLDVESDGTPTDLVAADRADVEVTRWIDTRGDPDVTSAWSLEDGTLRLDNSCRGVCIYDDRFRVEVPEGVRVLRDGEPTDLKGE